MIVKRSDMIYEYPPEHIRIIIGSIQASKALASSMQQSRVAFEAAWLGCLGRLFV